MRVPRRSLVLMGALTLLGSAAGAYIMSMAALSPCPLLVHQTSGAAVIVSGTLFCFVQPPNNLYL